MNAAIHGRASPIPDIWQKILGALELELVTQQEERKRMERPSEILRSAFQERHWMFPELEQDDLINHTLESIDSFAETQLLTNAVQYGMGAAVERALLAAENRARAEPTVCNAFAALPEEVARAVGGVHWHLARGIDEIELDDVVVDKMEYAAEVANEDAAQPLSEDELGVRMEHLVEAINAAFAAQAEPVLDKLDSLGECVAEVLLAQEV